MQAIHELSNLIDLTQRADQQIDALANTLQQVVGTIDGILESQDRAVTETLVESATGSETAFLLTDTPLSGIVLRVNGTKVTEANYTLVGRTVTPNAAVPVGAKFTAAYTVAGMARLVGNLLEVTPDLDAAYFLARKDAYETAIAWIKNR
jgi:hypothetical protein